MECALQHYQYLLDNMRHNPDLDVAALPPRLWEDVITKYEPGENDDCIPLSLRAHWTQVAVDAVAVHIISDREVNVTIPVATGVLENAGQMAPDPNLLVKHLSALACELFKQAGKGAELQAQDSEVTSRVTRHKKELSVIGEDTLLLKQASSDRPAFCIQSRQNRGEGPAAVAIEWSHAYYAQGQAKQHELQQTLLARTYHLDAAVAILRAHHQTTGHGVPEAAISFTDRCPKGAELKAALIGLLTPFQGVLCTDVRDGHPLHWFLSEEVELPRQAIAATRVLECRPFMVKLLGEQREMEAM